MQAIGVDVGGSGVRAAYWTNGTVGDLAIVPGSDVMGGIEAAVEQLGAADIVGVGVPGFIREGRVLGSPNLPHLNGEHLQDRLMERLGCPVVVLNDANAAAMGAWASLNDPGDLLMLTLGTGVGGGIILGGRIHTGSSGTGAEVGHVHIGGDLPCGCGAKGCLETWAGSRGLIARARQRGETIDGVRDLVNHADAGQIWAQHLLHEASKALGQGIRSLLNVLGIERVMISGGVSFAEPWLRPGVEAHLREQGIASNTDRVDIQWTGFASEWAIAGAAAHALSVAQPR